jgi:hypothetical protein
LRDRKLGILAVTEAEFADALGLWTVHVNRSLQELRGNDRHLAIAWHQDMRVRGTEAAKVCDVRNRPALTHVPSLSAKFISWGVNSPVVRYGTEEREINGESWYRYKILDRDDYSYIPKSRVQILEPPAEVARRRAQAAAERLETQLRAGSLRGRFVTSIPGTYEFVPADATLPRVAVANPARVGPLAANIDLSVSGDLDIGQKTLKVVDYAPARSELKAPAVHADAQKNVNRAYAVVDEITQLLDQATRPGAGSANRALTADTPIGKGVLSKIPEVVAEGSSRSGQVRSD